ncbi:MAG TPA: M20 family peptidase [Myxococcota bacterium]|nr:M20 family peptidase [Myxococcota bacterium]
MKRALALVFAIFAGLAAFLLARALSLPSRQVQVKPAVPVALDEAALASRLADALRFQTISYADPAALPRAEFEKFQRWLAEAYPLLHARLSLERVSDLSLLYTWQGRNPQLPPILLLAHQDVVPVEAPERWTEPPFAGRIDQGFVWGRGAIDDKSSLLSICEAVELLLARGFQPERTVLLAFGHDEEVGGTNGATQVAALLASRSVHAWFGLDEGGVILTPGVVPGIHAPVALVGVAEKGFVTLDVVAQAEGGHSSMPPRHTAAGILAKAILALEAHPMPGGVGGVTGSTFAYLAPEMPLLGRMLFANLWLFGAPLDALLSSQPSMNAFLRTTTAVTQLAGSPKDNVLPSQAIAGVNFRILPGDTVDLVLRRARAVVDDPRVEVRLRSPAWEPSPVSPIDSDAFALLERTIRESFPEAIVAPSLVVGGTDARHYGEVTKELYRFQPFSLDSSDLKRPHGIDERMATQNYAAAVRYQVQLLQNAAGSPQAK